MKQLTVRGFDVELTRRLKALARREGISLNKAALKLLRRGAGLDATSVNPDVVGDSLDHLIGKWSPEDEEEFNEAVAAFERIDESLWS